MCIANSTIHRQLFENLKTKIKKSQNGILSVSMVNASKKYKVLIQKEKSIQID